MNRTRMILSAAALAAALALPATAFSGAVAGAAVVTKPGAAVAWATPVTATANGTVTITVACASPDAAAATLAGRPLRMQVLIPMDAAAREGEFASTVRLPARLRPRAYSVLVTCSDGSTAAARLRVVTVRTARDLAAARRAATAPAPPWSPVSTALGIGGVALMAVGAVAGGSALALRRRARPRSRSTAVRRGRTPTLPAP